MAQDRTPLTAAIGAAGPVQLGMELRFSKRCHGHPFHARAFRPRRQHNGAKNQNNRENAKCERPLQNTRLHGQQLLELGKILQFRERRIFRELLLLLEAFFERLANVGQCVIVLPALA